MNATRIARGPFLVDHLGYELVAVDVATRIEVLDGREIPEVVFFAEGRERVVEVASVVPVGDLTWQRVDGGELRFRPGPWSEAEAVA